MKFYFPIFFEKQDTSPIVVKYLNLHNYSKCTNNQVVLQNINDLNRVC